MADRMKKKYVPSFDGCTTEYHLHRSGGLNDLRRERRKRAIVYSYG
jgi:hypothetical protein